VSSPVLWLRCRRGRPLWPQLTPWCHDSPFVYSYHKGHFCENETVKQAMQKQQFIAETVSPVESIQKKQRCQLTNGFWYTCTWLDDQTIHKQKTTKQQNNKTTKQQNNKTTKNKQQKINNKHNKTTINPNPSATTIKTDFFRTTACSLLKSNGCERVREAYTIILGVRV
jgi:hypothetical protein